MLKKQFRRWLFLSILLFTGGLAVLLMAFIRMSLTNLPSVGKLESYVPPLATKVVDAYGLPIGEFFTERRTTVPLTKIPVDLRHAVMAIEDTEFYDHWGIDLKGILRAVVVNLKAGRVVQGGSTLTQQLSKTIFLSRQKTFVRKFKELLLTLQIEHRYSKDEILELYLNQIYFGAGAYGVEAAAQLYYNKHTQELNLAESALIAGLVRSPNRYSPLRNPELAVKRRSMVLASMVQNGFIEKQEETEANETPVVPEGLEKKVKQAHYFLEEIKKNLEPKYGLELLEQGGLTIQSTLDLKMQQAAEEVMQKHLEYYDLQYGTATLDEYNKDLLEKVANERQKILTATGPIITSLIHTATGQIEISTIPLKVQGALVALDIHTGAIRAMVGGRDFFSSQFNRATQAKRQPGSSFKPFVWAAALEKNFTAATIIDDYPLVYIDMESDPTLLAETTSFALTWNAILDNLRMTQSELNALPEPERNELLKRYWRPQNYDYTYKGAMTLRRGLEKSRNLISIRIIGSIGARKVVKMAQAAGIKASMNPVLSLALGTSVVSLIDLTNAYGTFGNGGLKTTPYYVERITDYNGKIIEENSPQVTTSVSPQTAFLITNLLQGVVQHGTGWYAKRLGRNLAGKTGTTQDARDLLFIGFSPDLVCGVWVGYDDFRPMKKGKSASSIAVPLWTSFMRSALKDYPKKEFTKPDNIEFAKIDTDTGFLALSTCPHVILEAFLKGTIPTEFCPFNHDETQAVPTEPDSE